MNHTLSTPDGNIDDSPECWLPLKNFEHAYEISNLGRVRLIINWKSHKSGYVMHPNKDRLGYKRYHLTDKNGERRSYSAHRMMYETFIGEIPPGYDVDHINNQKGDNRLINLQLLTHRENVIKGRRDANFIIPRGSKSKSAKLDENKVKFAAYITRAKGITAN
jgi:hypothetical protein